MFVFLQIRPVVQVKSHAGAVVERHRHAHSGGGAYVLAEAVAAQFGAEVRYQIVRHQDGVGAAVPPGGGQGYIVLVFGAAHQLVNIGRLDKGQIARQVQGRYAAQTGAFEGAGDGIVEVAAQVLHPGGAQGAGQVADAFIAAHDPERVGVGAPDCQQRAAQHTHSQVGAFLRAHYPGQARFAFRQRFHRHYRHHPGVALAIVFRRHPASSLRAASRKTVRASAILSSSACIIVSATAGATPAARTASASGAS